MKKLLYIMTLWLLSIAAFCSCSSVPEYRIDKDFEGTVIITGTAADMDTQQPVEGVKMRFEAFYMEQSSPAASQNAYTDSKGSFNIRAEGMTSDLKCIITTEHPDYSSISKEIIVNWSGTSFDMENNTFFVNDCDFHLEKTR